MIQKLDLFLKEESTGPLKESKGFNHFKRSSGEQKQISKSWDGITRSS